MSGRRFLLLAICLVFINTADVAGENAVSVIDSLIQLALKNNPDIQAAQYNEAAAQYRAEAAGVLPDPKMSIAAINLPRTSLGLDETPMSGIVLGLSQTIPWPSKLSTRGKIADLMTKIKTQDIAARENSIIRMVTEGYYEYSYWSAAENILDQHSCLLLTLNNITLLQVHRRRQLKGCHRGT